MGNQEISEQAPSGSNRLAVAALQVVLGALTPLLLISLGGAGIYAAPVLLPLLWITARASGPGVRWYFLVLGCLTAAETAWAVAWNVLPGLELVLPLLAALGIGVLIVKTWDRALPAREVILVLLLLAVFGALGLASMSGGEVTSERIVQEPGR